MPAATSSGAPTKAMNGYGRRPVWSATTCSAGAHSPKYRYSGEATRRLLGALPAGPDGARTVRYTNPASGGPVMSALDCYAVRLSGKTPTRPTTLDQQHGLPGGVRLRSIADRRAHVRVVASRRLQHSALDMGQPSSSRRRGRSFRRIGQGCLRAARPVARGIAIDSSAHGSGSRHRRRGSPRRG